MFFRKRRKLLQENEHLILEIDLGDGLEEFPTVVQENDTSTVKVIAPTTHGVPIPLQKGLRIRATLPREDALYWFDTLIVDREPGLVPMLVLSNPDKLNRIQRRRHFRSGLRVPVEMMVASGDSGQQWERTTADMSGGGIRIKGDSLPLGATVHLKVYIPSRETPIFATAKVTRTHASDSAKIPDRWIAVQFDKIKSEDREEIVQHVFNQARKLKKEQT